MQLGIFPAAAAGCERYHLSLAKPENLAKFRKGHEFSSRTYLGLSTAATGCVVEVNLVTAPSLGGVTTGLGSYSSALAEHCPFSVPQDCPAIKRSQDPWGALETVLPV